MTFMRSIIAAAALVAAPAANASTLFDDTGTVDFSGGFLSFSNDSFENILSINISLSDMSDLNDPTDFDFDFLSSAFEVVSGRATAISSIFDVTGEDSITLDFALTADETGTYSDPYRAVLMGQFGTGFDAFTATSSASVMVETIEATSPIPLPAGAILLLTAVGALRLRRRS